MDKPLKIFGFVCCILILVNFGIPQQVTDVQIQKASDEATLNPYSKSTIISPKSYIEFISTKEEQKISAIISMNVFGLKGNLVLDAPVSKSSKEVVPLTIDGLTNSSSIKFGIQKEVWNPKMNVKAFTELREEYKTFLIKHVEECMKKKVHYKQRLEEIKKFFNKIQLFVDLKLNEIFKESLEKELDKKNEIGLNTGLENIKNDIVNKISNLDIAFITYRNLTNDYKQKCDDRAVNWGTPLIFNGGIQLGKVAYNYVTNPDTTFDISETKKIICNLNLSIGLVLKKLTVLLLSFQNSRDFKEGDKYSFNIPYNNQGVTYQKELSVGEPQIIKESCLKLELKRIFSKKIGINPSISYFFKQEVIQFRLPFYFLQYMEEKEIKGLNGGVYFDWKSDVNNFEFKSDNYSIGIFLGVIFDKFN